MSLFKRITTTLQTQFEEAVSRIENHDAVIEAGLNESREAISRLKVQQSQTRRSLQAIDEKLAALQTDIQTWTERARQSAARSETQALACLERRAECQQYLIRCEQQRTQQQALEQQLSQQLDALQNELADKENRLQEYRHRDLSNRARQGLDTLSGPDAIDMQQAFDRWELDITRREVKQPLPGNVSATLSDPLQEKFLREEQDTARRAELHALLQEKQS